MTLTAQPGTALRESGRLAVDLSGVVKRFGAVTAVDGIDLQIRAGESTSVKTCASW
ncbi:MAG: type transport system ATP-binding protein [Actinoplanes sp.]|jgi:ABC-2 type transport system ATP-binding protein|nr:type transport system ATP-binding protein [Actinoplanes sp.]